jgi:hypothetical protein
LTATYVRQKYKENAFFAFLWLKWLREIATKLHDTYVASCHIAFLGTPVSPKFPALQIFGQKCCVPFSFSAPLLRPTFVLPTSFFRVAEKET